MRVLQDTNTNKPVQNMQLRSMRATTLSSDVRRFVLRWIGPAWYLRRMARSQKTITKSCGASCSPNNMATTTCSKSLGESASRPSAPQVCDDLRLPSTRVAPRFLRVRPRHQASASPNDVGYNPARRPAHRGAQNDRTQPNKPPEIDRLDSQPSGP